MLVIKKASFFFKFITFLNILANFRFLFFFDGIIFFSSVFQQLKSFIFFFDLNIFILSTGLINYFFKDVLLFYFMRPQLFLIFSNNFFKFFLFYKDYNNSDKAIFPFFFSGFSVDYMFLNFNFFYNDILKFLTDFLSFFLLNDLIFFIMYIYILNIYICFQTSLF